MPNILQLGSSSWNLIYAAIFVIFTLVRFGSNIEGIGLVGILSSNGLGWRRRCSPMGPPKVTWVIGDERMIGGRFWGSIETIFAIFTLVRFGFDIDEGARRWVRLRLHGWSNEGFEVKKEEKGFVFWVKKERKRGKKRKKNKETWVISVLLEKLMGAG